MNMCDCGECEDCTRAILINERDRRLAAEDREATLRERLAAAEAERAALSLQLQDARSDYHTERQALERAEAALSRARELLKRFVRLLPRSLDMGRLPFAALHDEAAAFVAADPANTPKEPTADGK